MTQTCCFLCKTIFHTKTRFDIRNTYTASGEMLLLNLIEIVVKEKVSIYNQPDICFECCELLHELDNLNQRTKQISDKLRSYLNRSNAAITVNAFSQTDIPLENIINTDFLNKNLGPSGNGCKKCAMMFATNDELKEHNKIHVIKTYTCQKCDKIFISKNGAALHLKKQHPEEVEIASKDMAEEITETREKMEETDDIEFSMLSKENVEEVKVETRKKIHVCPICSKEWKTRSEMKNHINTHNGEKLYICEMCGKDFRLRSALDVHIGMHNGINPFACKYCGKTFTQKAGLQRHVRIHTGEKPFQCDLCGKTFIHHSSFKVHCMLHSGKKTRECTICNLKFYSNSHLKRHMRLHTGEKNYICPVCGKRFAEKYNLVSHQKIHDMPNSNSKRKFRCALCCVCFDKQVKLDEHVAKEHLKFEYSLDKNIPKGEEPSWLNLCL